MLFPHLLQGVYKGMSLVEVMRLRPNLFEDDGTPEKSSHGHQSAPGPAMGFAKSAKRAKREEKRSRTAHATSTAFFDVASESPIGAQNEATCRSSANGTGSPSDFTTVAAL